MPGEKAFKSRLARATKGGIRCAPWILLSALAIRVTVRDEWYATAPFFYAFPQPVQAFGWTVLTFIALSQRKRFASLGYAVLALALGGIWFHENYRSRELPMKTPADATVLFWNTAYTEHPNTALIELVTRHSPDIVALVEAGGQNERNASAYETALPDYRVARGLGMNLGCWIREDFTIVDQQRLPNRSGFARIRSTIANTELDVIIVDIGPNAFFPRGKRLRSILDETVQSDRPTIVAGDFNTPWDSAFFDAWRDQLTHADDSSGIGFRETWRSGLPLLAIDHVWVTSHFQPTSTQKIYSITDSDHACLIVKLGINEGRETRSNSAVHGRTPPKQR